MRTETPMVIDCETCPVRHVRCDDCIVTALGQTSSLPPLPLASPSLPLMSVGRRPPDLHQREEREHRDADAAHDDEEMPLDAAERRAVGFFVRAGLVDPQHAAGLSARRESSDGARAVG